MKKLKHRFVEFIPAIREEGVVYVSTAYAVASHSCACGCGREVVTPISPTDWKLIFDGETISLFPSIGNWSFKCKSHYWITNDRIYWAEQWSDKEIEAGRLQDLLRKQHYYKDAESTPDAKSAPTTGGRSKHGKRGIWSKLREKWFPSK